MPKDNNKRVKLRLLSVHIIVAPTSHYSGEHPALGIYGIVQPSGQDRNDSMFRLRG